MAMGLLFVFVCANLWVLYQWRLDEGVYWRWPPYLRSLPGLLRRHVVLIVGLVGLGALQIYPAVIAPLGAGDEPSIALTGPNLLSKLWSFADRAGIGVVWVRWAIVGIGVMSLFVAVKAWPATPVRWLRTRIRERRVLVLAGTVAFVILGVYVWGLSSLFTEAGTVDPPITFHREPPLSRFILVGSTLLLGATEFAARAPQVLFLLGAIVYLYRLVALFRDSHVAILSALAFGLMPPVFYYAHTVYLEAGLLFFVIAASYYFLRHLRLGDPSDLLIGALLSSAGFLYKRPVLVVAAVFAAYILLLLLVHRRWLLHHPWPYYARAGWLCLAGVLPWLIVVGWFAGPGRFLRYRYDLDLGNWLSPDLATEYFQQLPLQLGWPIAALSIAALAYAFIRRRDLLLGYTIVWFLAYYVFFASDSCTHCLGLDRFALAMLPPLAIWITDFVVGISAIAKVRWVPVAAGIALIIFMGLISTQVRLPQLGLGPKYASYLDAAGDVPDPSTISGYWREKVGTEGTGSTLLPYGRVFENFRREPDGTGKMLIWHPNRMDFYSFKYEIDLDVHECSQNWDECKFKTKEQLADFSRNNEIKYVLMPIGHDYLGNYRWNQFLDPELGGAFQEGNLAPFELAERFDHGSHGLLFLRVPDTES